MNVYRHNNSNLKSLWNNLQSTSREETKEPPSSVSDEAEKALHKEDRTSLLSEFEKYEEKSHENE